MANSITAAPAVLAEAVLESIKGKLPVLSSFSSIFSALESQAGIAVQVPLIGVSTATEFGSSGYATQDDATVTAATVTLKHFKVVSKFTPLNVKSYGMPMLINSFVPTAANAIAEKCLAEIGALITTANYASTTNTGAALSYAELVTAKGVLDTAKAPGPYALVLNSTYLNGLLSDSSIIAAAGLGAGVITGGKFGTLAGMNVNQWNSLPTNSESLAGFACGPDAIACAASVPLSEIPGYETAIATDPQTGLSIQVLMGQDQSGFYNVIATLLFGAAVGRATSLTKFTTS